MSNQNKKIFLSTRYLLLATLMWLILSVCGDVALAASDWYVRPAGGNYGSEDGSSYQNAWDGLSNVVWGPGGVEAGDTLYICGLHVYDMTELGGGARDQADIIPVSGTDDDTRVTIRGDYSGDQGVVWGAFKPTLFGDAVQQDEPNDDVWKFDFFLVKQSNSYFWEDITIDGFTLLSRQTSVENCQSNNGSFYWDSTNVDLYVNPVMEGDPTGHIYGNKYGYDWKIDGLEYITFLNLKFYSQGRFIELDRSASHITWEGCTLSYCGTLYFSEGSHYIKVIDCELGWMANGIYTRGGGNDTPSNYIFRGNYIHDIGNDPITYNSDAHGIGIMGGHNGLIEKNYILRAGNAILLHAFSMQELKDTIVRYNYVKDTHTSGGMVNGKAITTQCSNTALLDKTGNEFYGNIIDSANSYGFYLQFEDEQLVYNNVIYNCSVGIGTGRMIRVIYFDNGIVEFNKHDVITNGLGVSATVGGVEQSGTSPNITGILALDDEVGTWSDDDNIQIDGDTKAQVNGDEYKLGANIKARNNIILDSKDYHVSFFSSSTNNYIINFDYNLYYPDTGTKFKKGAGTYDFAGWQAIVKAGCTLDPNTIIAEPLFISSDPQEPADFKLQFDSPAIDAGIDVGISEDFDGNPVPYGAAPDIGAYEYGSSFLKYDVNGDGYVNIQDVQCCVNHIADKQDWGEKADVNGDGKVDDEDVEEIVNIILGK